VTANLRQTKKSRYEIKDVPKWKAVSSHIGRRSFATNYYGKINTALLISATGHASEKQFLTYVGKPQEDKAMALARALKQFALEQNQEPQLKVIKNASNG
jgi:intein/homing endonuclease